MKHLPTSKILSPFFWPLFLAHHDDIIIGCHIKGDLKKNSHDDFHDLTIWSGHGGAYTWDLSMLPWISPFSIHPSPQVQITLQRATPTKTLVHDMNHHYTDWFRFRDPCSGLWNNRYINLGSIPSLWYSEYSQGQLVNAKNWMNGSGSELRFKLIPLHSS